MERSAKSVREHRAERLTALLVEARRAAGLTQEELAARLGHRQAYVSKYERGARGMDLLDYLEIAAVLGFDPAEILKKLD